MDRQLQLILLATTVVFLIYIINLVRNRKLELRYTLVWMLSTCGLIIITIVPGALGLISEMLHIVEPVNTLFLVIIFLMILVVLSLTKTVSDSYLRISTLTQEVGLLKLETERLRKISQQKEETI